MVLLLQGLVFQGLNNQLPGEPAKPNVLIRIIFNGLEKSMKREREVLELSDILSLSYMKGFDEKMTCWKVDQEVRAHEGQGPERGKISVGLGRRDHSA